MADKATWKSTLIAIFVAGALTAAVLAGVAATTDIDERMQTNTQAFDQLCTDVYGNDATIYSSNTVGHGGLHWEGEGVHESTFHLSQIPQDTWQEYKAGDVSAEHVLAQLEPVNGGLWSADTAVPVLLLVAGAVVLIVVANRLPPLFYWWTVDEDEG